MVPKLPGKGKMPTPKELHDRKCFLLGIDESKWPRLWEAEKVRLEKATPASRYRPGNRHGRRG